MSSSLGAAVMITWAGYGVIVDKVNEQPESLIIYISVPENSYHKDVNGNEMSGAYLAKIFKERLTEMGIKRLVVKYQVRKGEHWTEAMRDNAELSMKKTIYGSQY